MKSTEKFTWLQWLIIITIPIGSIFIVMLLFLFNFHYESTLIIISILLMMNLIVFYFYHIIVKVYVYRRENERLQMQSSAYFNQFEIIKKHDQNISILRHDIKNHILSLRQMLNTHSLEETCKYLDELYEFTNIKNQFATSSNQHINSILNFKLSELAKLGTDIKCQVDTPTALNISPFDMSIILGNLLDNTYDALMKAETKRIDINISFDRNLLFINISNSYNGNVIKQNSKFMTSKLKAFDHGIGLKSVEKAVEKNMGTMTVSYDTAVFTVNIILCND